MYVTPKSPKGWHKNAISLSYDLNVTELLKQCSQRIYLLRLLRNQGLSPDQLNTVFVGLIVSRLLYALPAWGVLVSAA